MEPNPVWAVDGVDYSDCIAVNGMGWDKNDIEDDDAGRDDGPERLMHRSIGAKKRALKCKCVRLSYTRAHALAVALDKPMVRITYIDLILGQVTKTFYGTKISSTLAVKIEGKLYFDDTSFDLVEV